MSPTPRTSEKASASNAPLTPGLTVRRATITDSIGKQWGRIHVTFTPDVTASGSLSFASWDYNLDSADDLLRAQTAAIANARTVLMTFAVRSNDVPLECKEHSIDPIWRLAMDYKAENEALRTALLNAVGQLPVGASLDMARAALKGATK